MDKSYLIGLTGGIASGKSEACSIFEKLGAQIIDADQAARKVVEHGQKGYNLLRLRFPAFFDESGNLNRKELRNHVFGSERLSELNRIMLPLIIEEIGMQIFDSKEEIIIVAAPLLIECDMHKMMNTVICVMADREQRISRIMARDNIDRDLAERMINSQTSDEERRKNADIIILNNGRIEDFERQVKFYYDKIKKNINNGI